VGVVVGNGQSRSCPRQLERKRPMSHSASQRVRIPRELPRQRDKMETTVRITTSNCDIHSTVYWLRREPTAPVAADAHRVFDYAPIAEKQSGAMTAIQDFPAFVASKSRSVSGEN
jgi:hypothetical protein